MRKLVILPGFLTFYRWLPPDLSDLVFWNHSFSKHWATHSGRTWCPDAPRKNKIKSISIWYPSHYFTKKSICTLQFLFRSFSFFSLRLTKVLTKVLGLLSEFLSLHMRSVQCTYSTKRNVYNVGLDVCNSVSIRLWIFLVIKIR